VLSASFVTFFILGNLFIWLIFWITDFDGIRSQWKYRHERRRREFLSFDEFYQSFYASCGIPCHTVDQFLDFHARF
jgi:hypothetical protein